MRYIGFYCDNITVLAFAIPGLWSAFERIVCVWVIASDFCSKFVEHRLQAHPHAQHVQRSKEKINIMNQRSETNDLWIFLLYTIVFHCNCISIFEFHALLPVCLKCICSNSIELFRSDRKRSIVWLGWKSKNIICLQLTRILLITNIVVFNLFYLLIKSLVFGIKCVFKHQDLQRIDLKLNKYE